jgi:diguanylate cyclase (GGDEF)-like protein/PAS domain S-box-containing protein
MEAVILIIDDDPSQRKTLADIFRVKGYEVLATGSGAEGLALLGQQSINLALIDLGLPDISGLDVLERLKASRPATEAIVLTGQATVASAIEAVNQGAYSYMLKPYDMDLLLLYIKRALEKQRTEEVLRLRQRAIEASSNGIMIVDITLPDKQLVYVNPAFEQITGYACAEALGRNARFLSRDDGEQTGCDEIRAALREERDGHTILRNYRKDGSLFWNALSIAPVRDDVGKVTHFVGIINDITEQKRYEEQLEYQANHDELTDLPNRNLLSNLLVQFALHAQRYRRELAVLFIDLDHFKFVNDSLGRSVGDRLLKTMAERLRACARAADMVARHGGDEFVVVLPDLRKSEDVGPIAQKIRESLSRPILIDDQELVISCSIGISIYPKDGDDAQTLLKNADAAMFRAKEQGRNNSQFYTREMNTRSLARMIMEKHLRRALENGELEVHYQPQVDLTNGRVNGREALLRWRNPELGMVSPAAFIPLAEETGLIGPIFEWVLEEACAQSQAWQEAGLPALTLAVNVSPTQFRDRNLCAAIDRILRKTGLAPSCLEVEVTECMLMHNVESAMLIMKELKQLGIALAMDDFGTGYSSLSYLKRFPFDKLKIDISFVREVTTDPESAAIARAIIAMGHNLNLRVIAEGIETAGQLAYLRAHGCDDMQGFLFSRALPAAEFEALLRADRRLELPTQSDSRPERTLLLVDDDPAVTSVMEEVLGSVGYRILTATCAEDGLELLAIHQVGVMVCDQRMPGMNGIELLRRCKEIYPDTVRILLSGYADQETVLDAVNQGAVYKVLAKPFNEQMLRQNVRDAFRRYELASGCESLGDRTGIGSLQEPGGGQ